MIKKLLLIAALVLLTTEAQAASSDTCYDTEDTVALIHADGADASTTFSDESGTSFTANGNAQIDTAQSKFGGASGLFDGTGDYLTASDSADWALGSGAFTIEAWVRFSDLSANRTIASHFNGGTNQRSWQFLWATGNVLRFRHSTNGTNEVDTDFSWTPSTNTWYHVAIIRTGTTVRAFVDGTQIGVDATVSATFFDSSADFSIGATAVGGNAMSGWLDEVRVVKGTAIWTSSFTAPSAAYSACVTRKTALVI